MRHIKTNTRERKALHQAFLRFLAIPVILAILSSVLIGYTEYHKRLHEILDLQHEQVIAAMIAYRNSISYMTAIARTIEADYADIAGNENPTDALESLYKYNLRQYPIIDSLRTLNLDGMETLRVKPGRRQPPTWFRRRIAGSVRLVLLSGSHETRALSIPVFQSGS